MKLPSTFAVPKADFRGLLRQPLRQLFSQLLVIAGLGLLTYVLIEYGSMYAGQKQLQHRWAQQNSLSPAAAPAAPADNGLTRLSIPRIALDAVIVEGISYRKLAVAPGHIPGTPAPGELGNSVISAHRDTFFRHIYELKKGDDVIVRRSGKTFTFTVTGKKITDPDDVSVMKPTQDAQLTLITCYPTYYIGPAPERLVIFAKLAPSPGKSAAASIAGPAQ
jgi:LPXTG-site transpeptidase (sortase) family protein